MFNFLKPNSLKNNLNEPDPLMLSPNGIEVLDWTLGHEGSIEVHPDAFDYSWTNWGMDGNQAFSIHAIFLSIQGDEDGIFEMWSIFSLRLGGRLYLRLPLKMLTPVIPDVAEAAKDVAAESLALGSEFQHGYRLAVPLTIGAGESTNANIDFRSARQHGLGKNDHIEFNAHLVGKLYRYIR